MSTAGREYVTLSEAKGLVHTKPEILRLAQNDMAYFGTALPYSPKCPRLLREAGVQFNINRRACQVGSTTFERGAPEPMIEIIG
jgi:hypothetical protein